MSSLLFFLFPVLAHLCCYVSSSQSPYQPKTVFLLAGQGNMAGRGGITIDSQGRQIWDGIVPAECQPNPSILRLDAHFHWVEAREPLHADIYVAPNRSNGIGPGMPFAHAILKTNPSLGPIGVIPCAYGASNISEWQRGTKLYRQMIKRARAALKNNDAEIGALLWWQGGADSEKKEDALSFKAKTIKFFNDIRVDLKSPQLPILQMAVAKKTRRFSHLVRAAQLSMHLPKLITLDSPRLPVEAGGVDFTSQSQVIIGRNLAKESSTLIHS